jgi:transposase InsO family protein
LVTIAGRGNVLFCCSDGNQRVLADVYFIPKLRTNIISLGQLDENGCKSVIEGGYLCIFDQQRRLLVRVKRAANRLYVLNLNIAAPVCLLAKVDDPTWLWHTRLGHLHFRAVNTMSKRGMVRGMPHLDHIDEICDGCTIGKQHRLAFPSATKYRSERPLDLIHTDLCGPIKPATGGGNQYFLLVVDDHSRYMWLELLKTKDEAFVRFKKIQTYAEAKQHCRLRAFRSDRGGEFNSNEIKSWCAEHGVEHFTTALYSPQQNGVVERCNQTVVEMARCMMKSMAMPAMF